MHKIFFGSLVLVFTTVYSSWAYSNLAHIVEISKNSTIIELQQFAMRVNWRPSLRESTDLWSSREAVAFQALRSKAGNKELKLLVYTVDFSEIGKKQDVFFFFYQDRLFAINFFIDNIDDTAFVKLVQEMGGSTSDGFLGYGKPIEVDSPFITYMWYLNVEWDQTLIMTYLNQNIMPLVNIQIVHEKLLPGGK
ncbi:hypothetical protein PVA44_03355 [Entomospira nematocerorum]|uniref:Uncharacterized protein n=1 Tax=Entomospira nematocerorum TaxID=2719987 RepID=A0A968GER1_9SPIO|nr:hypothetical protein [Entomospira nematocera]NIZ46930.1 hypothetical protein [Entomospira nematocera]WDI33273.1 hypothetical protein PVA44_03355 [Entomospira nematocera]